MKRHNLAPVREIHNNIFLTGILQGLPGPESERNAIEVVLQYAVEKLGFSVSKIVIYAWSIGEGCS